MLGSNIQMALERMAVKRIILRIRELAENILLSNRMPGDPVVYERIFDEITSKSSLQD
jgi:hypothetical protein